MTTIQVEIQVSKEWVAKRRLETGENVPDDIMVEVRPGELDSDVRRMLLEYGGGRYVDMGSGIRYGNNYQPRAGIYGGRATIVVDSDSPTPPQIGQAIRDTWETIAQMRKEHEARQAKEEAARIERERLKREELEKREAARVLLADELATLQGKIDSLVQSTDSLVQSREKAVSQRDTLARFLRACPTDCKVGTLKRMAMDTSRIAELRDEIEDASPAMWIFTDDEDDEG